MNYSAFGRLCCGKRLGKRQVSKKSNNADEQEYAVAAADAAAIAVYCSPRRRTLDPQHTRTPRRPPPANTAPRDHALRRWKRGPFNS